VAKEDVKPAAHEAIDPPAPEVEKVKITRIPSIEGHQGGGKLDKTVKGGMIVARIMDNTHFQVQNAEGEPIPGKIYDPVKRCVVDA
jgi:hypothetical protein